MDKKGSRKSGNYGSIFMNGRDLTKYNRVPFFSIVGQDSDLFRGLNLLENIKYGSHTLLNDREINITSIIKFNEEIALHNAALDSQLYSVIEKQKDGWLAPVGPRGRLLSGGERQRVCLARSLFRQEMSLLNDGEKPIKSKIETINHGGCILLMDEVTSSLDAKTESIVTDAVMARVKKGATAILIAHRLSSVQRCDIIIVMKDGQIVERGTHSELISSSHSKTGWYAEAWHLQSSTKSNK
jgi:ABC-type multidrug transport system fused ATPase/permease subunit